MHHPKYKLRSNLSLFQSTFRRVVLLKIYRVMNNLEISEVATEIQPGLFIQPDAGLPLPTTASTRTCSNNQSPPRAATIWSRLKESLNLPVAVYFILSAEFCERFSFYGMKTILPPYLLTLGLTTTEATMIIHGFIFFAYFVTLFGGWLADAKIGKFKTILYLSIVYCLGNATLSVSSMGLAEMAGMVGGLLLIGLGTGGIKPCVSTFGGDQFVENRNRSSTEADGVNVHFEVAAENIHCEYKVENMLSDSKSTEHYETSVPSPTSTFASFDSLCTNSSLVTRQKATFFSFFYFAINAGSLLSMAMTPILKESVSCYGKDTCYPLAFGIPSFLMAGALLVFVGGSKFYRNKNSKSGIYVFSEMWKVIWYALKHQEREPREETAQNETMDLEYLGSSSKIGNYHHGNIMNNAESNSSTTHLMGGVSNTPELVSMKLANKSDHFLDCARPKFGNALVDDILCVLRVVRLFIPTIFFWSLYDQQSSRWVYQGYMMDPRLGSFRILSEQMQLWNSILILIFIPLFNYGVYPLVGKFTKVTPLRKIITGMTLAVITFIIAGFLQLKINMGTLVMVSPAFHEDINFDSEPIFNFYFILCI